MKRFKLLKIREKPLVGYRYCLLILMLFSGLALSSPKQVIIVRHGDKLEQKIPGPFLSAKGQLRAMALANYYLETFGAPDAIIAANLVEKNSEVVSIRPVLTMVPLVNILTQKSQKVYPLLAPYTHDNYKELAHDLLMKAEYDKKNILVCWEHHRIRYLAQALGVKESIEVWPNSDFDTVYILTFNHEGKVTSFVKKHNQYPVNFDGTWFDILKKAGVK
ncbi:MAG: hypothetical protein Q8R79_06025 [Legionellaceae bacterium]|nr:hypothetical protein [Legionellaceae bacterium]